MAEDGVPIQKTVGASTPATQILSKHVFVQYKHHRSTPHGICYRICRAFWGRLQSSVLLVELGFGRFYDPTQPLPGFSSQRMRSAALWTPEDDVKDFIVMVEAVSETAFQSGDITVC